MMPCCGHDRSSHCFACGICHAPADDHDGHCGCTAVPKASGVRKGRG